ncbi:general secretion pathway protein GspK [Planctomycetota bacterium]
MNKTNIEIKRPGFVLITVLLTIILLTVVLLEFNYASRVNLHAADDFYARAQSLNCARSGLNIALAALTQNPDLPTNPTLRTLLYNPVDFNIDSGRCTVTMVEENGKLNINMLKEKSGRLNRTRIDQFLRLIDLLNQQNPRLDPISYGLAPAIIDWTDPDDQVTILPFVGRANMGAESNYYQNADTPALCRNQSLPTIDELLLIKGITPDIFYSNPDAASSEQNLPLGLADYLTVYGDGKIDVNCAPELVIRCIAENIDPHLARLIIDRRRQQPFTSLAELAELSGIDPASLAVIGATVSTQPRDRYYKITSAAVVRKTHTAITAVIRLNPTTSKVEIILYQEDS